MKCCGERLHAWEQFRVEEKWAPTDLRCFIVGENPGFADSAYFYDESRAVPVRTILLRELHKQSRLNAPNLAAFRAAGFLFDHGIRCHLSDGEVKVEALKQVSIDIHEGEFVALIGPSGSGKSTLMNIVGCLDRPTTGSYRLAGEEVAGLNQEQLAQARNRRIGFVFQNFNLLSRTTALENVELPTVYAGVHGEERHQRARESLVRVGLEGRERHYPSQLSGGQQQRVAIARALVNRPAIVLADEPTGNLDSRTAVEIMDIFQRLNEEGITIVIVTHEYDIAAYAKRSVIFRDGKIRRDEENTARLVAREVLPTLPTLEEEEDEEESKDLGLGTRNPELGTRN